MKNIRLFIITAVICQTITTVSAGKGAFYKSSNQYKGFYWFEQKTQKARQQSQVSSLAQNVVTPEIAHSMLESRRQELESARSVMLEMGFNKDIEPQELYAAIVRYKRLEGEMYDGSLRLAKGWEMANFLYPELADNINNPVNVPANRIKRTLENEKRSNLISEFSKEFDLVLFTKAHCPYCKELQPVMKHFIEMYAFNLDVVDLSSSNFTGNTLAKRLNINAVPSVVAISKDGHKVFEIIRGFASISELEGNIELGMKWLDEQDKLNAKR